MKFSDLKWSDQDDWLGETFYASQRLRDKEGNRFYIYRWLDNRFTVSRYGANWEEHRNPGYVQHDRGLDALDVATRLLELEEDTRVHKNLHINEPR